MKKINLLVAVVLVLAFVAVPAFAEDVASGEPVSFGVSASVPPATGVSITATKRLGSNDTDVANDVTVLDFGNAQGVLNYDSVNGIWTSEYYYLIDVGLVGGAGDMTVTTVYGEGAGAMPAGQTKGLGYKATANFVKVTGLTGDQTETSLSAGIMILEDLKVTGETIPASELTGGFFRLYVGIYDGSNADLNADGGEPFTSADQPGLYTGTITITGTVT